MFRTLDDFDPRVLQAEFPEFLHEEVEEIELLFRAGIRFRVVLGLGIDFCVADEFLESLFLHVIFPESCDRFAKIREFVKKGQPRPLP